MNKLKIFIITMMIIFPFSLNAVAISLMDYDENVEIKDKSLYSEDIFWSEVGNDFYQRVFYATGNIFIEYGYFQKYVMEGLDFYAKGQVSFFPEFNFDHLPLFQETDEDPGVKYFEREERFHYLVTEDAMLEVDTFFSRKNIYVIGNGVMTAVPLPAASLLFASGLSMLLLHRRINAGR